ncbi:MAG: hypothetical protein IJ196_06420 [Prevotella sp.]|nr:hypothetical protein [Prevotella sp.]
MKQLNKTQTVIFMLGGLLMVIGAGAYALLFNPKASAWIFLIGAILFTLMQAMQIYEGQSLVIKRLKRIQSLANICFIIAALLMVNDAFQLLLPLFKGNYITYVDYLLNKWVILLLIAAILELYTTHRISSELEKDKKR